MNCNNGCQIPLAGALYCHHCHQREVEEAYQRGKRAGMEKAVEIAMAHIYGDSAAREIRLLIPIRRAIPDVAIEETRPAPPKVSAAIRQAMDVDPRFTKAMERAFAREGRDCTNKSEACAECGKNERVDGEFFCAKCLDDFDSRDFDRMETPRDYGYDGSGW